MWPDGTALNSKPVSHLQVEQNCADPHGLADLQAVREEGEAWGALVVGRQDLDVHRGDGAPGKKKKKEKMHFSSADGTGVLHNPGRLFSKLESPQQKLVCVEVGSRKEKVNKGSGPLSLKWSGLIVSQRADFSGRIYPWLPLASLVICRRTALRPIQTTIQLWTLLQYQAGV